MNIFLSNALVVKRQIGLVKITIKRINAMATQKDGLMKTEPDIKLSDVAA